MTTLEKVVDAVEQTIQIVLPVVVLVLTALGPNFAGIIPTLDTWAPIVYSALSAVLLVAKVWANAIGLKVKKAALLLKK
jgi:hypothetical protein